MFLREFKQTLTLSYLLRYRYWEEMIYVEKAFRLQCTQQNIDVTINERPEKL